MFWDFPDHRYSFGQDAREKKWVVGDWQVTTARATSMAQISGTAFVENGQLLRGEKTVFKKEFSAAARLAQQKAKVSDVRDLASPG